MNRSTLLLSLFFFFCSFSINSFYAAAPDTASPASPIYIAAIAFELYETRSTAGTVVMEVPKGAQVKVVNSSFGSWWQIEYKRQTGFVQSSKLKYSQINDELDYKPIVNSSNLYNSKPTFHLKAQVNLYEHDSSSSAIVMKMPTGANVKVIDSSNNQWWLVHFKGRTGYARSADMNYSNDELVARSVSDKLRLVTKATSKGPSSKDRVILRFEPGDQVIVLDDSDHWWWKVSFAGKQGWVKRHLLEE